MAVTKYQSLTCYCSYLSKFEMFTNMFNVMVHLLGTNRNKVLSILIMVMVIDIGHVNGGMKGLSNNKGSHCMFKKCSLKWSRKLCSKVTVNGKKAQQQQKICFDIFLDFVR